MNYQDFRNKFNELGCFSAHQVGVAFPNFDRNNFTRWQRKGYILKLRQGFYSFAEYVSQPNFVFFVSNYIYKPSYISLHSALAFYGIIPEAVTQITAVSALKTAGFENGFGSFSYMKIKEDLFFGYDILPLGKRNVLMAQPEKAILDLLYLYPFYNTGSEIENLRFDEHFIFNELNIEKLAMYLDKFKNKNLKKRVKFFTDLHNI